MEEKINGLLKKFEIKPEDLDTFKSELYDLLFSNLCVKVVLNTCYGGFNVSDKAWNKMIEYGYKGDRYDIERHNLILVKVVEELGTKKASGMCARLEVEEYYLSRLYRIEDHDGKETLHL